MSDGDAACEVSGFLEMAGEAVCTFGDGAVIDGGRAQRPHHSTSASGPKRDLFPEQFDQSIEVLVVDECRDVICELGQCRIGDPAVDASGDLAVDPTVGNRLFQPRDGRLHGIGSLWRIEDRQPATSVSSWPVCQPTCRPISLHGPGICWPTWRMSFFHC